jgi:hypothetical protein
MVPTKTSKSEVRGVTTCALVGKAANGKAFVALGHALCDWTDPFSRSKGRTSAFWRAVDGCGLLNAAALDLARWFQGRFPGPPPPKAKTNPLSADARLALRQAGAAVREIRRVARTGEA